MNRLFSQVLAALGVILYWLGLHRLIIRMRSGAVRVLLYHDCEEGESDFTAGLQSTTSPGRFAAHLAYYARHYNVIPLSRLEEKDYPGRAAVITFDDGYRSVLTGAVPQLERLRLPATVYLVTSVVDNARLVWVNEMNWLARRHGEIARPLLSQLTGLPASAEPADFIYHARVHRKLSEIEASLAEICRQAGLDRQTIAQQSRLYLTWGEVRDLRGRNLSFGNHTLSHPNLAQLDREAQRQELSSAWSKLAEQGCSPGSLAYPFGDHSSVTQELAAELGFTSIVEVGCRAGVLDLARVGRVPVDGIMSEADLFAQIEIVQPIKGWLKRLASR